MTLFRTGQRVRLDYPDGTAVEGIVSSGMWSTDVMFVSGTAFDLDINWEENRRGAQATVLDEVKATN